MLSRVSSLRTPNLRSKWAVVGVLCLILLMVWVVAQPARAAKFTNRSMYINSARASDTTYYIISFQYTTPANIGSVKMEFCTTPIPSFQCVAPSGLDVSNAVLSAQSGETGFSIGSQTANEIILSRTASLASGLSSYRFDNVINPDGTGGGADPREPEHEKTNFYVRLTSHVSNDGTGAEIDFGSVANMITPEVGIYTQVPPILIFCAAGTINDDECTDMDGDFVNFGELEPDQTYYTKSEFQAFTNAQYGYSVTVVGNTMTSGIRSIPALTAPTQSLVGVGQFGINLAVNSNPAIGAGPVGPGINAIPNADYTTPDEFMYSEGDFLVTSSEVTMTRKFTVSYILNVPEDQAPGVYSTTLTYICLAGF